MPLFASRFAVVFGLIFGQCLISVAQAQNPEAPRAALMNHTGGGRALWLASLAAVTAANVADAYTSWNRPEANGLLAGSNGTFGPKGAAIKISINTAWIVGEAVALRAHKRCYALAIANFAAASVLAAAAYHNRMSTR